MAVESTSRTLTLSAGARRRSLRSTALGIAALALLASLAIGYLTYVSSRKLLLASILRSQLRQARILAAYPEIFGRSKPEAVDLAEMQKVWRASPKRFPGSYLCFVDGDGRLDLHTASPQRVGEQVGELGILSREPEAPHSVADLLAAKQDWAGENRDLNGQPVISAFVYSRDLEGLVGLHVPAGEVLAETRAMALPWAVGLGALTSVLTLLFLGLLYSGHIRSERTLLLQATALESAANGILLTDSEGVILWVNSALCWLTGHQAEELVGQTPRVFKSGMHPQSFYQELWETVKAGRAWHGEMVNRRKDGSLYAEEQTITPVRDERQRVTRFISIKQDVTARKQAAEALRESQRMLATLMSSLPGMVYRCRNDPFWTMEFVSEGAEELTGYRPADLVENRAAAYADLIHPDDRATVWDQVQAAVRDKEFFELSYRIRTATGEVKQVWEKGRGVFSPEGELTSLEGFITDVTERRRLEEQLQQVMKMEAVGQLAGGVAHDFNNLLNVILGYSELLVERLEPSDPRQKSATEIHKAGQRAAALTRQLLAFSRKQVLAPQVVNLNAVVRDMEPMLRRVLGENVVATFNLDPRLGATKIDPAQLEQVVLNLVVNARDAMPRGGRLTLETSNLTLDEDYARQHATAQTGPHVLLAVSDTGVGMSREVQARIFEPFFTTKEEKGTGLGLATVYGIVKQSGGWIWVYSEPNRGSTFKIYLPRVAGVPEAKLAVAPVASRRGTETVLVVEDEAPLRQLVLEFLRSAGYNTLEASDGHAALRLAASHPAPIHLLLTDVVMPGMSGRELADQLIGQRPELKVVYVSGYADNAVVEHGVLEPGTVFLQKPFTLAALAQKVREALEGRPAG